MFHQITLYPLTLRDSNLSLRDFEKAGTLKFQFLTIQNSFQIYQFHQYWTRIISKKQSDAHCYWSLRFIAAFTRPCLDKNGLFGVYILCFLKTFLKNLLPATLGIRSLPSKCWLKFTALSKISESWPFLVHTLIIINLNVVHNHSTAWCVNWTSPTCQSIPSYHIFQWIAYGNGNQIRNSILDCRLRRYIFSNRIFLIVICGIEQRTLWKN